MKELRDFSKRTIIITVLMKRSLDNGKSQRENCSDYHEAATKEFTVAGLIKLLIMGKELYVEQRKLLI